MTFRCPSPADVIAATLALLPRGRAWQNHEGGPLEENVPGFARLGFDDEAFSISRTKASVLRQYWTAVAQVIYFVTLRICQLRMEFWCATRNETNDIWMIEYGLPDACDPFPELCAKVAAIGGTRCEYYTYIAERAGWRLICYDGRNLCGVRPGAANARAGRATPGRPQAAGVLRIVVDIGQSPAVSVGFRDKKPRAGRMQPGRRLTCFATVADLAPIECLLARVVHAEVQIIYEVFR